MSRQRYGGVFAVMFSCAVVSSCTQDGPSEAEVRDHLALTLPGHVRLESFALTAKQNVGSAGAPVYKSKFEATVKLLEDVFVEDGSAGGLLFLRPTDTVGAEFPLHGFATATPRAGTWQVDFAVDGDPLAGIGRPRSAFQGRTAVRGSQEDPETQEFETKAAKAEEGRRQATAVAREKEFERIPSIIAAMKVGESKTFEFDLNPGDRTPFFENWSRGAERQSFSFQNNDARPMIICITGICGPPETMLPKGEGGYLQLSLDKPFQFKGGPEGNNLTVTVMRRKNTP